MNVLSTFHCMHNCVFVCFCDDKAHDKFIIFSDSHFPVDQLQQRQRVITRLQFDKNNEAKELDNKKNKI